jgi:hypothetical protein
MPAHDPEAERTYQLKKARPLSELAPILSRISDSILTQDPECTGDPVFQVRVRRRITGMDTDYADEDQIVWIDSPNDHCLADAEEFARLEAAYQDDGTIPEDWIRTGFILQEEVVTECFTRQGCEDYLRVNGHNLRSRDIVGAPFIYVDSLYRNAEMIAVREALMQLGPLLRDLPMYHPFPDGGGA